MIVGLTGIRNIGGYKIPNPTYNHIYSELTHLLSNLKPDKIISGGAIGFDILAIRVAIDLEIPFDVAVPFIGQEKKWYPKNQEIYHELLKKANKVVIVSEGGFDYYKLHKRNQFICDNSDMIVSCWDGKENGGTYHCIKYAQLVKKKIVNIELKEIND